MSQSNVIFAYLLAAFIVFITMRGELPIYLGFLLGKGVSSPGPDPVAAEEKKAEKAEPSGAGFTDANPLSRAGSFINDIGNFFGIGR